jgi:uncharacterized membrane protein YgcG
MAATSPPALRISLRELLTLVAIVAVGCVALKYANEYWVAVISFIMILAVMAAAIIALVDRGPRQASAIGCLSALAIYAALLYACKPELDPYDGTLPTTRLMRPLFEAMSTNWYFDLANRKEVNQSQLPSGATIHYGGGGGGGIFGGGVAPPTTGFSNIGEKPSREHFMPIAHYLWALIFGYVAARFARWVYARRVREQQELISSNS